MNKIKIMCRYKKIFYLVFLMVSKIITKVNTQEKNLRFVVAGHLCGKINIFDFKRKEVIETI